MIDDDVLGHTVNSSIIFNENIWFIIRIYVIYRILTKSTEYKAVGNAVLSTFELSCSLSAIQSPKTLVYYSHHQYGISIRNHYLLLGQRTHLLSHFNQKHQNNMSKPWEVGIECCKPASSWKVAQIDFAWCFHSYSTSMQIATMELH